jgi:hypothetical protein
MMITPEREYPMILTGVKKPFDPSPDVRLDLINLNSSACWFEDDTCRDGTSTVVPRQQQLKITSATQLDKESILICYESRYSLCARVSGEAGVRISLPAIACFLIF